MISTPSSTVTLWKWGRVCSGGSISDLRRVEEGIEGTGGLLPGLGSPWSVPSSCVRVEGASWPRAQKPCPPPRKRGCWNKSMLVKPCDWRPPRRGSHCRYPAMDFRSADSRQGRKFSRSRRPPCKALPLLSCPARERGRSSFRETLGWDPHAPTGRGHQPDADVSPDFLRKNFIGKGNEVWDRPLVLS